MNPILCKNLRTKKLYTAATPGAFAAAPVSIPLIVAEAWGLRRTKA